MRRKLYLLTFTGILFFCNTGYARHLQNTEMNNSFYCSVMSASTGLYHYCGTTMEIVHLQKNYKGSPFFSTTYQSFSTVKRLKQPAIKIYALRFNFTPLCKFILYPLYLRTQFYEKQTSTL